METCKYSDWTRGQVEALINIIGEENARKLLAGDLKVSFEEVVKTLFDKHGRRIPEGLNAAVCDPDRAFQLSQPHVSKQLCCERLQRLHKHLGIDTGITGDVLWARTNEQMEIIVKNKQIANILQGVWLPSVLPQLTTDDLGTVLEQYLKAVNKSYVKTFNDRKFYNYQIGVLTGSVSIVKESRYDQLIEKMKQGPVMGIHFPNPLQGFSINASREQTTTLPKGFFLSGLDTVIAMVMYPDILAWDYHVPALELDALSWLSAGCSLSFQTYGSRLDFSETSRVTEAFTVPSGGLFFCG